MKDTVQDAELSFPARTEKLTAAIMRFYCLVKAVFNRTVVWEFGRAGYKGDMSPQASEVGHTLQLQGHSLGEHQGVKCGRRLEGEDRLRVLMSFNAKIKPGLSLTELT